MANVLPVKKKKNLKIQKLLRFLIMLLLVFIFGFVSAMVVAGPSYLNLKARLYKLNKVQEGSFTKKQKKEYVAIKDEVIKVNDMVSKIGNRYSGEITNNIKKVLDIRSEFSKEIFITSIRYSFIDGDPQVRISGIASDRNVLAKFRLTLDDAEFSKGTELPLKDLKNNLNVPFSITIKL